MEGEEEYQDLSDSESIMKNYNLNRGSEGIGESSLEHTKIPRGLKIVYNRIGNVVYDMCVKEDLYS